MGKPLPSTEYLRQCFSYCPESGLLYWLHRPDCHFPTADGAKIFNGTYAGNIAGTLDEQSGYVLVGLDGVRYRAHRLIYKYWYGKEPEIIDHINHQRNANQITNLRSVTVVENAKHRKSTPSHNTRVPQSGVMGVNWDSSGARWKVRVWDGKNKKHRSFGRYKKLSDAIDALNRALKEIG